MINYIPLQWYVDRILSKKNFRFLRIGDGEMWCYSGLKKRIAKGEHNVLPKLTKDIRFILSNLKEKHVYGLQPLVVNNPLHPEWMQWIPEHNWHHGDVFHQASSAGELYPFFAALKKRYVVIIGSKLKRKMPIPYQGFIEVREVDCYYDKKMVLHKMDKYPDDTVFLFAASRLSVPAIYQCKRNDCTMIDVGSLFDPYLGVSSRRIHKLMTKDIINKNLGR